MLKMWLCLASGLSDRQQNYGLRVAELIDLSMPRSLLTRNADEAIGFKSDLRRVASTISLRIPTTTSTSMASNKQVVLITGGKSTFKLADLLSK